MKTPTQGEHAQPEALRLADAIDPFTRQGAPDHLTSKVAADHLRALHAQVAAQPAAPQGGAYAPLQGLSAYLRAEAVGVQGVAAETLRQWASEVDAASHGQAPAVATDDRDKECFCFGGMCEHCAPKRPTAQPAPAANYDHGPQSTTVEEAARHVGKWLNERPNRPLDLRDVAMLVAHAQAPAAGAVAGPVEKQVQRIGKELLRSEQMHAAKPDRIASALRAMSESMHTDYKQEIGSNNCMQCCVAYMLGMPISQVPHFAQSNDPVACWDGFQSFIAKQGYTAVMLPGDQRPESHYLASGKSARGTSHMVVMHDGKLLHDPHPTNAGLVDVQCIWLLAKSAAALAPAAQGDAEDAARWRHFCARHLVTLVVTYFGNGCINKTIEDAVAAIDAERAALAQKEVPHGN